MKRITIVILILVCTFFSIETKNKDSICSLNEENHYEQESHTEEKLILVHLTM